MRNATSILWRTIKQTLVTTSLNHTEVLALHEIGREYIWLKSVIEHIENSYNIPQQTNECIIIYEDIAYVLFKLEENISEKIALRKISIPMSFNNLKQIDVK